MIKILINSFDFSLILRDFIPSIMTLLGTISGYVISFGLEAYRSKRDADNRLIEKRINTYEKCMKYIVLRIKLENPTYKNERSRLLTEESILYDDLFPNLSLLISEKKLIEFHDLLNEIQRHEVSQSEALAKARKIIGFVTNHNEK